MIAVCCDSYANHTNVMCGKNAEFLNVKTAGTSTYHCGLQAVQVLSLMVSILLCINNHTGSQHSFRIDAFIGSPIATCFD
jgi:hypothetical protein